MWRFRYFPSVFNLEKAQQMLLVNSMPSVVTQVLLTVFTHIGSHVLYYAS